MDELFRLRIAGKRQVTVPQRLMDQLGLSIDDELWVQVNGNDVRLIPMVQVPRSMVTPEFLKMLDAREQESKLHPLPEVADASTLSAQVKNIVAVDDLLNGRVPSPRVGMPAYGTSAKTAANALTQTAAKRAKKAGQTMDEQNFDTVG